MLSWDCHTILVYLLWKPVSLPVKTKLCIIISLSLCHLSPTQSIWNRILLMVNVPEITVFI